MAATRPWPDGAALMLAFRPQALILEAAGTPSAPAHVGLQGQVQSCEFLGEWVRYPV